MIFFRSNFGGLFSDETGTSSISGIGLGCAFVLIGFWTTASSPEHVFLCEYFNVFRVTSLSQLGHLINSLVRTILSSLTGSSTTGSNGWVSTVSNGTWSTIVVGSIVSVVFICSSTTSLLSQISASLELVSVISN